MFIVCTGYAWGDFIASGTDRPIDSIGKIDNIKDSLMAVLYCFR